MSRRSITGRQAFSDLKCGMVVVIFILCTPLLDAQEPPPRPIIVTATAQGLSFGTFTQGPAGGSVTVTATGSRSGSGDVILLGVNPVFAPALFEVIGNPGTVVSLLAGSTATLSGVPLGSMLLTVGGTNPASPFIINTMPPLSTLMYIGGVLTVGAPGSNPPGIYSGFFNITLIQE